MTLTDEEITAISLKFSGVHNFARAIEARVLEELRKQEPVPPTTRIKDFSELRDELDAAPIPHTPSHWTTSKLHGTAMSNREKMQHIANGKKFGGEFSGAASIAELHNVPLYAAHIPTPSQQEALDALDNMDDYARMMGLIAIGPIETLRDFILARPDTEGSGK